MLTLTLLRLVTAGALRFVLQGVGQALIAGLLGGLGGLLQLPGGALAVGGARLLHALTHGVDGVGGLVEVTLTEGVLEVLGGGLVDALEGLGGVGGAVRAAAALVGHLVELIPELLRTIGGLLLVDASRLHVPDQIVEGRGELIRQLRVQLVLELLTSPVEALCFVGEVPGISGLRGADRGLREELGERDGHQEEGQEAKVARRLKGQARRELGGALELVIEAMEDLRGAGVGGAELVGVLGEETAGAHLHGGGRDLVCGEEPVDEEGQVVVGRAGAEATDEGGDGGGAEHGGQEPGGVGEGEQAEEPAGHPEGGEGSPDPGPDGAVSGGAAGGEARAGEAEGGFEAGADGGGVGGHAVQDRWGGGRFPARLPQRYPRGG